MAVTMPENWLSPFVVKLDLIPPLALSLARKTEQFLIMIN